MAVSPCEQVTGLHFALTLGAPPGLGACVSCGALWVRLWVYCGCVSPCAPRQHLRGLVGPMPMCSCGHVCALLRPHVVGPREPHTDWVYSGDPGSPHLGEG